MSADSGDVVYYSSRFVPFGDMAARFSGVSAEQQARDMLERCGVEDAQSFSAGDVVELANLIAEVHAYRRGEERP